MGKEVQIKILFAKVLCEQIPHSLKQAGLHRTASMVLNGILCCGVNKTTLQCPPGMGRGRWPQHVFMPGQVLLIYDQESRWLS